MFEGDIEEIKNKWIENPYFESCDKNIRQMSVVECERLQTLPDNYTKYEVIESGIVETPTNARYEMVGNGWTVDVIAYLMLHIKEEK